MVVGLEGRKCTVKILAVIICFIAAGLSAAQSAAPVQQPHGLATLKVTWSRKRNAPHANRPPREEPTEPSVPKRRDDPNDNPIDSLRRSSPTPNSSSPGTYFYLYSLKIRNESGKGVRGVYWDYVASDNESDAELNRRQIINIQEINAGEVATLSAEYPSPPTNIVTAGGLGKDERSPFKSSADIRCVLYADGTVWQVEGGEKDCAELRQADARIRKGNRP
jgi:hypothetical protein